MVSSNNNSTATVPNLGLAFAMAENSRMMNGVGVKVQQPQQLMPWSVAEPLPMFPSSTTITAANPMAGTSFLSNLGGLTPITFANTTITTTGGHQQQQHRPVILGQPQQQAMSNCAVMDPMLVFSSK